ncbi:MAG: Gfo/Idh/MocA family oxidoreductase [Clostridia bacterium]|nr:Gfo/Idh/MocA family oxidoreductase [Clostridia bacterium]
MKDIKVAFIGLGSRGYSLLEVVLAQGENVVAVCDLYDDRIERAANKIEEKQGSRPVGYKNYKDAIADENVNTVVVSCAWEDHVEIAIAAMKAGKAVGMEVGGAYSVHECWELVRTYEQTRVPFMFLENCCFGRRELMVLNMVELGVLGKVVHCSGGYHHDLRDEIAFGRENRHYRLRNYISRNCENYPTHELGPIAKVLGINHGNRMVSLTSTASKAAGLHEFVLANKSDDEFLCNTQFNQGDVVTTVIKCANGETIVLTLDTTLPRFYSRGFTVRGTKGMYEEATDSIFVDGPEDRKYDWNWRANKVGNAAEYTEKYEHPIWKKYIEDGVQGGHDGMDYLEFKFFFEALRENKPMPVDVYDAASWMVITALSEVSIAKGSAPVEIPDFTEGKWQREIIKEEI